MCCMLYVMSGNGMLDRARVLKWHYHGGWWCVHGAFLLL